MLGSLSSGVSGIQQYQQQMDVIGNNISNVNTTGFKAARVNFEDSFSQTLRASSAGGATASGTTSMQVGTGVATAAIRNEYTQGTITRTNVPTDMAISGEGFFVVNDATSGATYLTRSGDFRQDSDGYLVTTNGLRVQGYSDSGLSTRGDIMIDSTGAPDTMTPGATVASFSIDRQGVVKVKMSDGTEFDRGQILLQNVRDPQALVKEGNNLYSGYSQAGPLTDSVPPGTDGLGKLEASSLELSNVDLASEFSTMITTQRAFQACARIVTTSDEMLQELVNLKR